MENNFDEYNQARSLDRTDRLTREQWPDPAGFFRRTFQARQTNGKLKNCYLVSGRAEVRLFFGNKQHILLRTAWRNVEKAMRVADAAVYHFWKYRRVAQNRVLSDSDFNCSKQTAEQDCKISFISELFQQYEHKLVVDGQLPKTIDRLGDPGLDQARIKMMQHWVNFSEYYDRVYNQCPRTPETKIQLEVVREHISQFHNLIKGFDSVVRQADKVDYLEKAAAKQESERVNALIADGSTT